MCTGSGHRDTGCADDAGNCDGPTEGMVTLRCVCHGMLCYPIRPAVTQAGRQLLRSSAQLTVGRAGSASKDNLAWALVSREPFCGEALDSLGVGSRARSEDDECADDAHIRANLNLGAGDLPNGGMLRENSLHLLRSNTIAECLHDVVGAPTVGDVTLFIHAREVAADEPLTAEHLRLLSRALPIAEHQARI